MPTIFSHPAAALGIAPWFRRVPRSLVAVAAICSALPDADVAAFGFGIPYEHPLGHRGFTHSITFAILLAAFAAFSYRRLTKSDVSFRLAFAFLFLVIVSHGLFDAMTNGGKGVGFFIPFSNERFFFPFRPIRVSPIGMEDFAEKAAVVLGSELRWVWAPFVGLAILGSAARRKRDGGLGVDTGASPRTRKPITVLSLDPLSSGSRSPCCSSALNAKRWSDSPRK